MITVTSDHRHAAIILILTELYNVDYTEKNSTTGGWLFNEYENYNGLNESQKNDLFRYVAQQLQELKLIEYKSISPHTGQIIEPRLTGQGELILAKLFKDESLNKFFQINPIEKSLTKKIILEKIKEEGIGVVVKVMSEGLKDGYTGLISMLPS